MSETKTNYQKIDAEVMNEAVQQYNITSVPTLVFEKDGSVIHRHTGVMSRGQLTNIINSL
jgi:thioredoxin-related protein